MATEHAPTNPLTGKTLGPHWRRLAAMLQRHGITLAVDIGANIGQYGAALRASGYTGRMVSVEPLSTAHAELARAAGRDGNWIVAPRAAVGAAPGRLTINVSVSSDMSSALPFTPEAARAFDGDRTVAQESVPVTTVDALLAAHAAPDDRVFLKSDTQGYDLEVLRGAAGSLDRIVGLQIEASLCPIYEGQPDWRAIVDLLAPRGFAIHLVVPGYFSKRYGRLMEMDLVFFRDGAAS
jgi:FkbM family methyltransferase